MGNSFQLSADGDWIAGLPLPSSYIPRSSAAAAPTATATTATRRSTARCNTPSCSNPPTPGRPAPSGRHRPPTHRRRRLGPDRDTREVEITSTPPAQLRVQPRLGLPRRPSLAPLQPQRPPPPRRPAADGGSPGPIGPLQTGLCFAEDRVRGKAVDGQFAVAVALIVSDFTTEPVGDLEAVALLFGGELDLNDSAASAPGVHVEFGGPVARQRKSTWRSLTSRRPAVSGHRRSKRAPSSSISSSARVRPGSGLFTVSVKASARRRILTSVPSRSIAM